MTEFIPLVAYAEKDSWTKWIPLNEWPFSYQPNYRQIKPEELILETDFPIKQTNKEFAIEISHRLQEQKLSHEVQFTGNKSYHVIILFPELKDFTGQQRTVMKKTLAAELTTKNQSQELDPANFNAKRLIGTVNQPHRTTGIKKTIEYKVSFGPNKIPKNIMQTITKKLNETNQYEHTKITDYFTPQKCAFLDHCLKNKIASGKRNQILVPNIVAATPWMDWIKFSETQEMELNEFKRWANLNPQFNCKQLQNFATEIKLQRICDICLLEEK